MSLIFLTLLACYALMVTSETSTTQEYNKWSTSLNKSENISTKPANASCFMKPKTCSKSRYRSFDGTCNNLKNSNWGAATTLYERFTKANYADGKMKLAVSVTGTPLPNAREISFRIFTNKLVLDNEFNINTAQWGQIITHDMSLTSGVPQINEAGDPPDNQNDCTVSYAKDIVNPKCAPILIPPNDPVYSLADQQYISVTRTDNTISKGCGDPNAPAQQFTAVTGFMDASLVYGSSDSEAASLRTGVGGKLKMANRNCQEWPPQSPIANIICFQPVNDTCYFAGDVRVNQNTHLTVLQVILFRAHNYVADKLGNINTHWNDETLYQETRRVIIALVQHINYYEFLPILLGSDHMERNKLIYRNVSGYVNDYNPNVNPSVLNEHASASGRHFHNLLRGVLSLITEDGQDVGSARMSDWFNKPTYVEMDNHFLKLVRGLTNEKMRKNDQYWSAELTNYLFRGNKSFGYDLRAIDIQRARDHGLGSYIKNREACHLSVPHTFFEMRKDISKENVELLKQLYESPKDVDLVVGGSLEHPVLGSMVGPTFLCILLTQFYKTRVGDRFFYENGADPQIAFTPAQLNSIRKGANMAHLICVGAGGIRIQPKAFRIVSKQNQMQPCDKIQHIDLTLWREDEKQDSN